MEKVIQLYSYMTFAGTVHQCIPVGCTIMLSVIWHVAYTIYMDLACAQSNEL